MGMPTEECRPKKDCCGPLDNNGIKNGGFKVRELIQDGTVWIEHFGVFETFGISSVFYEHTIELSACVRIYRSPSLELQREIMNMLKFEYDFLPPVTQLPAAQDQEGRIRAALGLTRGPLPKVKTEWLLNYHRYLASKLKFPFAARYTEELAANREPAVSSVEVFALVDPGELPDSESTALLCRVRWDLQERRVPLVDLEVDADHPNFQLLEDYWYWIWNWRFDPRI